MGLEAISAANGWAMALTGALIVMTGLSVLSFIISNLHKLVAILERTTDNAQKTAPGKGKETTGDLKSVELLSDLAGLKKMYEPLIKELKQPFQLSELYNISEKNKLPHTHLTIKRLREEGVLTPAGDGAFTWKQ